MKNKELNIENINKYDFFFNESDVDVDIPTMEGDCTGYKIEFVDDNGTQWDGEIWKDGDKYYTTWWNPKAESPGNWESIDDLVNNNFHTIQKIATPRSGK